MSSFDTVDLSSDDEIGESNGKIIKKPDSVAVKFHLKRRYKIQNIQNNTSVLDKGVSSQVDKSSLSSGSPIYPAPICRQFWKAGEYESGNGAEAATQNGKNHLRIHPMFLHSNATSHKWVFGAIAELLDNAVDEIQNGATFVSIDKILNPRDRTPALLIQDDGGGMDIESIRRCMSFGYSDKKLKNAIGQYGNGFKTSSMRLGADVIVFSRHLKNRTQTQSIGLLSYTFLRQSGHDRIVVPMVDYELDPLSQTYKAILSHGEEQFSSNLSTLLQWSPYLKEKDLLRQFDDIGSHGTKVIVYNLWLKDDGGMELDFDSESEDIRISENSKLFQATDLADPVKDQHIANRYRYSLRAYSSILYQRIPESFKIIVRGRIVELQNIANDLIYPEFVLYKPQLGANMEVKVITTIGFWKDSPHVNFHGFNIYHRNRLIMPFWSVVKGSNNTGRGVVGVLEANFIEPTHNKQEFEKTSLFQKLESRLKEMTLEYWHLHCALVGHQPTRKPPRAPSPSQNLYPSTQSCHVPVWNSCAADIPKAAFAGNRSIQYSAVILRPSHISSKRPREHVESVKNKSQAGSNVKWKEQNPAAGIRCTKIQKGPGTCSTNDKHNGAAQTTSGSENGTYDPETASLLKENKKLQSQLLEIKKREEELNLKVQRLRIELEDVHRVYIKLLAES